MLTPAEQLEHLESAVQKAGTSPPEIVLPAEHDVIVNRMRLHYLDWGNQDAPTILFLHGGALTAHTWDVVCLDLRAQFHCVALDQRGHGDSEWSPEMDYHVEAQVRDIEAFIDEQLGVEKLFIVGMSMGGLNAIAYGGKHSGRILGLVIIDVGPETREIGAKKIRNFTSMEAELDSIEDFVDRAMAFNPRRDPLLLRRSLLHNLRRMPDGRLTWKYDRRHYRTGYFDEMRKKRAELWTHIPNIACPTLVVRGAQSEVFHDEDAEKLAGRLPNGSWVRVENAGHTVQGDNPHDLIIALRAFFNGI